MSSSAGFAWILHDRPVNVFQSTGPTSAWRRQRLPHTEGCWPGTVSTSTFTATPTHHYALSCCPPRTALPAALRSHPRCLASFLSLCCSTRTHSDRSTRWTKRNVMKRITKMLLHIACLCACSLSWAFLLDWKSHGLKLFSYRLTCSIKECLCLDGFLQKNKKKDTWKQHQMRKCNELKAVFEILWLTIPWFLSWAQRLLHMIDKGMGLVSWSPLPAPTTTFSTLSQKKREA